MTMDRIYEEAADWLVREQGDDMDWVGFTVWLEADSRHRKAYDELALIGSDLDDHSHALASARHSPLPVAANDRYPISWARWAGLGGGAIAAGLAILFALQPMVHQLPVQDYRSVSGKSIRVALDDGSSVVLAPASHLTVKGQQLALDGTGYFEIRHKPGRTLAIQAGDFLVTDIGTRFSVGNETDGVSVDVAEGSLSVTSGRLAKPIALAAGHGLRADRSSGTVRLTSVDPRQVASWRSGKLQFDQVPLALVARDVSRYSGELVTVDPAIADRPFSGVIAIDKGGSPARTLAQILSLDAKPVDGGFRLESRDR
jgi:transmembrane sensor